LEKLERTDEAMLAYAAAIARDTSYADPHLNLAVLLGQAERAREAIPHLERYLALAPEASNAVQVEELLRRLRRSRRR